jgi:hypothetical protein
MIPCLNQWLHMLACACHPSYVGSTNRRIKVQARPGIKPDPVLKITDTKRAGQAAQVVERLLHKWEGLSSNSSATKENNNNNKASNWEIVMVPKLDECCHIFILTQYLKNEWF